MSGEFWYLLILRYLWFCFLWGCSLSSKNTEEYTASYRLSPEWGGWGSHRSAAALYSFSVFILTSQTLLPLDLLTQVKALLLDFSRKSISGLQKWWERKVIFLPGVEKGAPWTAQTPMCLICHVYTEIFLLSPHTVYQCYFPTVNINFIMILPSQYVPPNLHLINLFAPQ